MRVRVELERYPFGLEIGSSVGLICKSVLPEKQELN
jgi:hypothetical protein